MVSLAVIFIANKSPFVLRLPVVKELVNKVFVIIVLAVIIPTVLMFPVVRDPVDKLFVNIFCEVNVPALMVLALTRQKKASFGVALVALGITLMSLH